jgi:two-component system CheB/CheR fusion protein
VDPTQLQSALVNLALNARDAMRDGGTLTLATTTEHLTGADQPLGLAAGTFVMVAVDDTGHGMPPEVLERAFEPMFTTKGVGAGTGLGLSMVYGFAKQSGGHVTLRSKVGRGARVTLYLPAAEPDAAAAASGAAAIRTTTSARPHKNLRQSPRSTGAVNT